jgi:hypothetical protein
MLDTSSPDRLSLDLSSASTPEPIGDQPRAWETDDQAWRGRDLPDHLVMLSSSGRSVRLFTAPEGLGWQPPLRTPAGEETHLENVPDVAP